MTLQNTYVQSCDGNSPESDASYTQEDISQIQEKMKYRFMWAEDEVTRYIMGNNPKVVNEVAKVASIRYIPFFFLMLLAMVAIVVLAINLCCKNELEDVVIPGDSD